MREFSAALLVFSCLGMTASQKAPDLAPLFVVPVLDFERYSGTWYEIARFPTEDEKSCASDVTATYAPRPDGQFDIFNRCREKGGKIRLVEGIGRRVFGHPPSSFEVRQNPNFFNLLPGWTPYQVMELGPNYEYAVVGEPERRHLWILSRKPQMDAELYKTLVQKARGQAFDVEALVITRHTTS